MNKIEELIIWERAYARIIYDPEGITGDEYKECESKIKELRAELKLSSYNKSEKIERKYWKEANNGTKNI